MDSLQNRLNIKLRDLKIQVVSLVHDKEAAYASDGVGVDGMFQQRISRAIFSIADPLHGVKSLKVDKKNVAKEIMEVESILQQHHS